MSLSEFKLNQIKTGNSCLFIGKGSSQLASKLVAKKSEFGMNQGILFSEDYSKYDFEHQFIKIKGLGKKNIRTFHTGQNEGDIKKIMIIDNVKVLPSKVKELIALISDKNAMSKSLIVCIFDKNEDVPEELKNVVSHIFRLSDNFPVVVETEGQIFHM